MLIRQEGIGGYIVEIRTIECKSENWYCIELREVAGDWPLHWEIREDGTRPIKYEFRKTLEETNEVFAEYAKEAGV